MYLISVYKETIRDLLIIIKFEIVNNLLFSNTLLKCNIIFKPKNLKVIICFINGQQEKTFHFYNAIFFTFITLLDIILLSYMYNTYILFSEIFFCIYLNFLEYRLLLTLAYTIIFFSLH